MFSPSSLATSRKLTVYGLSCRQSTPPTGLFSPCGLTKPQRGVSFRHMFQKKPVILRATSALARCSCWVSLSASLPLTPDLRSLTHRQRFCGCSGYRTTPGDVASFGCAFFCLPTYFPVLTATRSDDEDYRWVVLRNKVPPWLFQIVNLTFIGMSYIA